MIDARRLCMLGELERLGTVAAVAASMHLTAPGVSMQLGALEREVGLKLTERRGRRLVLTPAGRVVAAHGRAMSEQLELAAHEIDALRTGDVGHCHVAAFPTAARTIVADVWAELLLEDRLTVQLTTAEPEAALGALTDGAADVAVVHEYSNVPRRMPDHLEVATLGTDPVMLVLPGGASHGEVVELQSLKTRSWIAPSRQRTCFDMVERACGLAGFRPNIVAESDDFDVQLALVRAGVGVALIPRLALDRVPDGVSVLEVTPALERHVFVATRAELRDDPCTSRVITALHTAASRYLHEGSDDRVVRH